MAASASGVGDQALLGGQVRQGQCALQCRFDAPAGRRVVGRHGPSHPGPVVELLLGRTAVACPFDRGRIDEIGGEPGDLVCAMAASFCIPLTVESQRRRSPHRRPAVLGQAGSQLFSIVFGQQGEADVRAVERSPPHRIVAGPRLGPEVHLRHLPGRRLGEGGRDPDVAGEPLGPEIGLRRQPLGEGVGIEVLPGTISTATMTWSPAPDAVSGTG